MSAFSDHVSAMRERDERRARTASRGLLPEAIVMEMRAIAKTYGKLCPYRKNDIVTPRRTSIYRDAGMPHIVLQVSCMHGVTPGTEWQSSLPVDCDLTVGSPDAVDYGRRLDMRVLRYVADVEKYVPMWVESAEWEIWQEATDEGSRSEISDYVTLRDGRVVRSGT